MRSVRPVVDVEHARARLELARVDAEVGELADEGVGHDLEGERRERLGVVGVALGRTSSSSPLTGSRPSTAARRAG